MANQHPITPPPELVQQWTDKAWKGWRGNGTYERDLAAQAARWGADQELEACLKWTGSFCATWTCGRRPEDVLRAARRPKPPTLKEQALEALETMPKFVGFESERDAVRRALEALPND